MDTDVTKFLQANGRKGGKQTATRGRDYYRKIGRKGLNKRWGKRTKIRKRV